MSATLAKGLNAFKEVIDTPIAQLFFQLRALRVVCRSLFVPQRNRRSEIHAYP